MMSESNQAAENDALRCPVHGIPDCSPMLNGCSIPAALHAAFNAGQRRALLDAADEFDRADEVYIGETDIGSNLVPIQPSERLRKMAEELSK